VSDLARRGETSSGRPADRSPTAKLSTTEDTEDAEPFFQSNSVLSVTSAVAS